MRLTAVLLALFFCSPVFAQVIPSRNGSSVRTVYSVTPVGTSTPVQVLAAVPYSTSHVSIFDSSGATMQLITVSAGITTYTIIPPGGDSFPLKLSKGDSVSLLALSGAASAGENDINFFY